MRRIGAIVRAKRDALGLSRNVVERRFGIPAQALQDLEDGRYKDIQLFRLMPMLAALGLRLDDVSRGLDANYDRVLNDHSRHGSDDRMSASKEAADVFPATQARVRELEAENAQLRERLDRLADVARELARQLRDAIGEEDDAPPSPVPKNRRHRRGTS
jgi:transcriptional regulator with XRE-family HTH domain